MAAPLPPATRRLVGWMLVISGGMLAVGLLLRVYVAVYSWSTGAYQNPSAMLLSANLLGLLASGLLMRMGLGLRRGAPTRRNPNTDGML
ncbi:hypothetical protein IC235_17910 [Hymenobacter sp. BT664]|uniref:Uncharacterized protein n=1 Tax=Hymenobacter montanus TaxID=2771359 RepID=A0A927BGS3_9BACT|nr:hypothetical protein [Hymenobacter montanus]MBD2769769.1 hypothetical protein [Hymenobacter montanus]